MLIKLKFTGNKAVLDIKNAGKDTMILNPKEMIGIVHIRCIEYYKIKQGILQQNLSRYYRFEEAGKLCEYFNKFIDTLKKDREHTTSVDKYPWLDPEDERRNMMDREILENYVDLETSCLNKAYPLVRHTFSVLGNLKCEVLSVLDLKDAFHSLRLSENSRKYCGILSYFGSSSYLYQRMPMGLNISPSIWQSYINAILNCLQSKNYCEAIMDDLILFTPSKESHINKLEDIMNGLLQNGLKVSPKKCQLFKTSL